MQEHDQDQELAAAVAVLLLVGAALIVREAVGLWSAVAVGLGPVLLAYWGPPAARRARACREVWRFRRRLAVWDRSR